MIPAYLYHFHRDHRSFHELDNICCHISNDHHDDQEKGLATKRSELLSEKPIVPNRYTGLRPDPLHTMRIITLIMKMKSHES